MVIILTIITTFIISAVSFLIGYIFSSKHPEEAIQELISAVKKDRIKAIRPKTREDLEDEEQLEADRMFEEYTKHKIISQAF